MNHGLYASLQGYSAFRFKFMTSSIRGRNNLHPTLNANDITGHCYDIVYMLDFRFFQRINFTFLGRICHAGSYICHNFIARHINTAAIAHSGKILFFCTSCRHMTRLTSFPFLHLFQRILALIVASLFAMNALYNTTIRLDTSLETTPMHLSPPWQEYP